MENQLSLRKRWLQFQKGDSNGFQIRKWTFKLKKWLYKPRKRRNNQLFLISQSIQPMPPFPLFNQRTSSVFFKTPAINLPSKPNIESSSLISIEDVKNLDACVLQIYWIILTLCVICGVSDRIHICSSSSTIDYIIIKAYAVYTSNDVKHKTWCNQCCRGYYTANNNQYYIV